MADAQVVVVEAAGATEGSIPAPPLARGITDGHGIAPIRVPLLQQVAVLVDHRAFAPTVFRPGATGEMSEIKLDAGRSWSGSVETVESGDLPSGGTVCASGRFAVEWVGRSATWQRCVVITPSGDFRLAGLPADGPLQVRVDVPGFLRLDRAIEVEDGGPLRLESGVRLDGHVIDPQGREVAGAEVRAEGAATAHTEADGRFSLSVPELPAELHVGAVGYRQRSITVAEAGELEVRLEPTEQVYGTLLGEPGDSLFEFRVWVQQIVDGGTRGGQRTVETDEDEFRLDLPGPGSYSLTFMVPGYREVRHPVIEVGAGQVFPLGGIPLSRGAGLGGTVAHSDDGAPLEGVLVETLPVGAAVMQALMGRGVVTAVTDNMGAFTLGGLDIGRYHVRWRRDGHATVNRLIDLEDEGVVDLGLLFLDEGVTLAGRLSDRSGQARAGLQVRLFDPANELLRPLAVTVSDGEGHYRFEAVAPGRYRVRVVGGREQLPGVRLLLAQEVEVTPGQPKQRLDLQVGGVEVRGRLTYGGLPVSDGTVTMTSAVEPAGRRGKISVNWGDTQLAYGMPETTHSAEVAEDGSFVLTDIPPGIVWLGYAGADGRRMGRSLVLPDRSTFALHMDLRGHPLEGRVVDTTSGLGLPATVQVFDVTGRANLTTAADPEGWFRFDDLESGPYDIVATAEGYGSTRVPGVEVSEESQIQQIGLEPREPGRVEVSLRRADGTGVPGVPVTVYDLQGNLMQSMPTPTSGDRVFENLPPGEYFVAWSDPLAGAGATSQIQVAPRRPQEIAHTLTAGASVVLVCPAERCADAPVELVAVHSADGLELSPLLSGVSAALRFSDEGDLSLGRLAPGRYLFRLWVDGERWQREVTVGTGEARVRLP
ncbi:MAG: carboxypeptidase regulatory-like domain-containing protein [Thermoanaerobaculia bacterium]